MPEGEGVSVDKIDTLLSSRGLVKSFEVKQGLGKRASIRAVDGVDFDVHPNRVFSIVGESGCGKSTVARLALRLMDPTEGQVLFRGANIFEMDGEAERAFRRAVQIVFQDPFASLNPRRTVYQTISEPVMIHGIATGEAVREEVKRLLATVGLHDVMERYPHEFSGGQRQRICIARALAVRPELIVMDEPLSALDVSIQAQIINLLIELKEQASLSYIFISHDLRVVRYLSDEVAVMYLGRIVEQGPSEDLFNNPLHPYTNVLLESAPSITSHGKRRTVLATEVPSLINLPTGCPFHPRCPRKFAPCDNIVPTLTSHGSHSVACHLHK